MTLNLDIRCRDTICAPATPAGRSALSVIRVSGPDAANYTVNTTATALADDPGWLFADGNSQCPGRVAKDQRRWKRCGCKSKYRLQILRVH